MSDDVDSRIKLWKPPIRPEWVEKMNQEGRYLDLKSVVPLDENSLIERAKANTGLSDFGSDDWYGPFKMLLRALDTESDLNLMGRLMTRSDLLMHLEARLRVEETYKRYPQIDAESADSPLLIIGSGRSGTSALQNFFALDPDNASPQHWEALFPCPPPEASTYRSDPRIAVAHGRMDQWNRVTPELISMHEFGGDMPTELIQIEALAFQNNAWLDLYGLVPSYDASLTKVNFLNSLKYSKRILKLLQWKNPRARWVLKSPDTMRYMPEFFQVFPGTQLIWIHRDPLKSLASFVSLIGTLFWIRSDQPLSELAIAQLTNPEGLAGHFNNFMDLLERGEVPADAIHHVQYVDFTSDPLKTMEKLYPEMGITLTEKARSAMAAYQSNHPRESRPLHRYERGDNARLSAERKLFERYQRQFKVPSET